MKTAFITGITGQDGAYLAKLLLDNGYHVIGGARRSAEREFWRLKRLNILDKIEIVEFDLTDYHNMVDVIRRIQPDEFYNLAAQSFVGTSFKQPISTLQVNGIAVCQIVEILSTYSKHTRFYQASTSEMFGDTTETPQTELTRFNPASPYGIAKLMAHNFVEMYRRAYGFFGCCGILFNHESALRGDEFVTKKITNYVRGYNQHLLDEDGKEPIPLQLGNLYSKRDWGFSGDYVKAMWKMLQSEYPGTFVISSGSTHTIKDFVEMAFDRIGVKLFWDGEGDKEYAVNIANHEVVVEVNPEFYRPNEVSLLVGGSQLANTFLDWKPKYSLEKLVEIMVDDKPF